MPLAAGCRWRGNAGVHSGRLRPQRFERDATDGLDRRAGSGFGASQGTSQVLFAGASVGPAVAWSETSLTVAVPAGANTGPLVVEVGGSSSSPTGFIVTPPPLPSVRIGTDVPAALSEYPAAKAYEPPREIRRLDCLSQATMA